MIGEKNWCELYKDVRGYIEQILESVPYKTVSVAPFTSHLASHQKKTNMIIKICWTVLESNNPLWLAHHKTKKL